MKKLLFTLAILFSIPLLHYHNVSFAAETKKVCVDKIANNGKPVLDKAGKPVQDCKEIKVHKKLEGTQVPKK